MAMLLTSLAYCLPSNILAAGAVRPADASDSLIDAPAPRRILRRSKSADLRQRSTAKLAPQVIQGSLGLVGHEFLPLHLFALHRAKPDVAAAEAVGPLDAIHRLIGARLRL